jgi:putative protease
MEEKKMDIRIGEITHYYNNIGVAVLALEKELKVGDTIHILGHTTDFTQVVSSLEIEHKKIQTVKPGSDVALKVLDQVRKGDQIFKVMED